MSACFGAGFVGDSLEPDPRHRLHALVDVRRRGDADLLRELAAASLATFLYFPYWLASEVEELGVDATTPADTLQSVRRCWPRVDASGGLIERGERVLGTDRTFG